LVAGSLERHDVQVKRAALIQELTGKLLDHEQRSRKLPGIAQVSARTSFMNQLVESIRRVEYIAVLKKREISPLRTDPLSELFDPVMAAALQLGRRNLEEAFWLVFLSVHFGKHRRDGWRLARDVYAGSGSGQQWTWDATSSDPKRFRSWLAGAKQRWGSANTQARFGNHRKYESLDATSPNGTGAVIESYVKWVGPQRSHGQNITSCLNAVSGDPRLAFDRLYQSMRAVRRFGRTARFDYLTMLGKLELAAIEPGSIYLSGSTGPLVGARLLFGGRTNAKVRTPDLEAWAAELGTALNVGMQVMEDALCNWQKSPTKFVAFRG
jgi:hypothetical protein